MSQIDSRVMLRVVACTIVVILGVGTACDDDDYVSSDTGKIQADPSPEGGSSGVDAGIVEAGRQPEPVDARVDVHPSQCQYLADEECEANGCFWIKGADILKSDAGCAYGEAFKWCTGGELAQTSAAYVNLENDDRVVAFGQNLEHHVGWRRCLERNEDNELCNCFNICERTSEDCEHWDWP